MDIIVVEIRSEEDVPLLGKIILLLKKGRGKEVLDLKEKIAGDSELAKEIGEQLAGIGEKDRETALALLTGGGSPFLGLFQKSELESFMALAAKPAGSA